MTWTWSFVNRGSLGSRPSAADDLRCATLKTFPDVGHTISSEESVEAALFLRERFD